MSEARRPFDWPAWALFEVRRGWLTYLIVSLIVVGIVGFHLLHDRFLHAKGTPAEARILSLTTIVSRRTDLGGVTVRVVARAEDGTIDSTSVTPALVRGCKVGDPVPAVHVGGRLRIEPWPCAEPHP